MSPTNLRSPVWLRLRGALWVPAYLAVFALLEHLPRQHYWATQLPLDAVIPFCPVFVVFYCVWYVLLIGTGLFLLVRDGGAFRRYMQFLALKFFLSAAVWFLIPSCQNLRPAQMEESSIFTALLALLYRIDTNTNVFPSAHVVGAIGAALALDGNMREVVLWTKDGAYLGEADDGDLFGTDYPWFCGGAKLADGSILAIMTEDRADESAMELVAFKLSGF